jgi:putative two-component system response regulator
MTDQYSGSPDGITVMVVDDEPHYRDLVCQILRDHRVIPVESGQQAITALYQQNIDIVLLDVMMPDVDGYEVCRQIKSNPLWRGIPVIMLTPTKRLEDRIRAMDAGADDFIGKPVDVNELIIRVKSSARLKQYFDQLENTEAVLFTLANVVEAKDQYTKNHLKRIASMGMSLAHHAGLSQHEQRMIWYGGTLHDIGKVGISDTIIKKPDKLTAEEFELVKQHTVLGERIVTPLRFGKYIGPIVRGHHEYWNGSGYPDGIQGDTIPIGARVITICDVFDALTTDRCYRAAYSQDYAFRLVESLSGKAFDPRLVQLFLDHSSSIVASVQNPLTGRLQERIYPPPSAPFSDKTSISKLSSDAQSSR